MAALEGEVVEHHGVWLGGRGGGEVDVEAGVFVEEAHGADGGVGVLVGVGVIGALGVLGYAELVAVLVALAEADAVPGAEVGGGGYEVALEGGAGQGAGEGILGVSLVEGGDGLVVDEQDAGRDGEGEAGGVCADPLAELYAVVKLLA